jgi:hypothetical protein
LAPARTVRVAGREFPVALVRHRRARRYVLRMTEDGSLRLTVPRGASIAGGMRFVQRQAVWIERESIRHEERTAAWVAGKELWWRGERVTLGLDAGRLTLGCDEFGPLAHDADVRTVVEAALMARAENELSTRCLELSRRCGLEPAGVAVRNARSRWGACSPRQVITLNWRLIQFPDWVRDYVIYHELMHLKQPNHSRRFWREVEAVCSMWREAEAWLRRHGRDIQ